MLPDALPAAHWAMEEGPLRVILAASRPEALAAYPGRPLMNAIAATTRKGVAVVPIEGPLFKKPNFLSELFGTSTYAQVRRDLQAALDDPNVKAILLNINSPGGEVQGTAELAQAIRDARGAKPIVAYAGDLAASAAYWIASAADTIIVGESAALGSIGVRAGFMDTSARDARGGVKSVDFVSSQSPFKKADIESDEGRARIQARVDALAKVFVEAVSANRGVSVDKVLSDFGKGDVLIGKAAIKAGLADGLGSFESVLAELAAHEPPSLGQFAQTTGANDMITAEQLAAALPKPAPVPPHVAVERARGLAITQMSAGHEKAASQAILEGWSVARFVQHVEDEEAAQHILRAGGRGR